MAQYIYGGNTGETPQSVARKRAIAEAIMGRTMSPQNVGEGFGAIADGIVANVNNQRADAAEQAGTSSAQDAFTKALMGDPSALASIGGSGGAPGGFGGAGGGGNYADAIAGIESGGNYGAVGPTDRNLGRALGKYQIMESNVGPWSKEILGREVSPDEFLANPQLQDAIFNGKFNQYVQQFGPEGAAQAWFAGPGSVGKPGAGNLRDSLGTSVNDYVSRFSGALGDIPAQPEHPFAGGGSLAPQQQGTPMPAPQMAPGGPAGGGVPALSQRPAQGGPDLNELLMLSANPWLTEGQRGAINTMIETQLKQQDPAYQLGLQKSQLELDALRNPTPKDTDDIREYNFAVGQGYQGSFADFQKDMRKAGATNVNVAPNGQQFAAPPFGQDYRRNPDGSVALDENGLPQIVTIPNGPQDEKARLAQEQQAAGQASRATSAGIVVDDIDRALSQIDANPMLTTGMGAAVTKGLPGLPAYQTNALIDTVKANAGFDRLQAMRDASPTGGALGQVSEQENKLLQAAIGNLDPGQDTAQLQYNLKRVSNIYRDIIDGKGNGPRYNLDTGELEQPGSSQPQKSSIDYSAPTAPEGWSGDPALWKFMSPEDRALWQ